MAFCSNCGIKIDEGLKFCTGCGTPVAGTAHNSGIAEPQKKISRFLLIAIVIAPVVLVITCTVMIIMDYKDVKDTENRIEDEKRQGLYKNEYYERDMRRRIESIQANQRDTVVMFVVGLVILTIATLIVVDGERKNNDKMIWIAIFVYMFSIVGLPSMILLLVYQGKKPPVK